MCPKFNARDLGSEGAHIRHHFWGSWGKKGGGGGGTERCECDQLEAEDHLLPSLPRTFQDDLEGGLLPSLGEANVPRGRPSWMRSKGVMLLFFHVGGGSREVWDKSSCPVFWVFF